MSSHDLTVPGYLALPLAGVVLESLAIGPDLDPAARHCPSTVGPVMSGNFKPQAPAGQPETWP